MGIAERHYFDFQRPEYQFEVIFSCASVTRIEIRVLDVFALRCYEMTDFKQQYKNPRPGFGDTDHRRYLRAYNYDKTRREVRTRTFDKNRNLQDISPTSPEPSKLKDFLFSLWLASSRLA